MQGNISMSASSSNIGTTRGAHSPIGSFRGPAKTEVGTTYADSNVKNLSKVEEISIEVGSIFQITILNTVYRISKIELKI